MFDIGDCGPPQPTMIRSGKQDLVCSLEIFELYIVVDLCGNTVGIALNQRVQGPNPAVPVEPERASAISRQLPSAAPCPAVGATRRPPRDRPGSRRSGLPGDRGFPPCAAARGPDPERLGHVRYCQVPSLPQLEHQPVATAVVVAVDEPRNAVAVVPSLKVDYLPATALAAVLPQVLLKPPDRDRSQGFQGKAGSKCESSASDTGGIGQP